MILTIAGTPGSGKTSAAKELAKRLNMKFYSMGDFLEKVAAEKNQTIDELISGDDEADHRVDAYQKKLGETEDNMIVEGRISWFFMPKSFKILVTCEENEAAGRTVQDKKRGNRPDEPEYASLDDAKKINAERVARFSEKFKRLYGIENYYDPSHYDFILDTTNATGPVQNADSIMAAMKEKGLIK